MASESEATTLQESAISTSLINPPPIFKKYFNDQDRYVAYQKKQYLQDDRFFFADEYNIKQMIRITEFERWFETVYARLLNVLRDPQYVESGELKGALSAYAKPNFHGHVLVGFDVEKISTNQLYIHKKTKMNIVNQNATHVARFVQLGFPTGYTIMFDALAATPEDWTAFYEFISAPKTILIGFDQADDWKCLKDMHRRDYYSSDARKMHSNVLAPSILVDVQIILERLQNSKEMNNSKRKRANSNGDEETDYRKKISKLEEQTHELGRMVEQLERQAKSKAFWIFNYPKMNNAKKREKIRQFCHEVLNLPEDWAKNLEIQWIGYYESKSPGNRINIKVDLMQLKDKETILANGKNLAERNKSRKPPIIVAPDLTKQQRASQKEKRKSKEKGKESIA